MKNTWKSLKTLKLETPKYDFFRFSHKACRKNLKCSLILLLRQMFLGIQGLTFFQVCLMDTCNQLILLLHCSKEDPYPPTEEISAFQKERREGNLLKNVLTCTKWLTMERRLFLISSVSEVWICYGTTH